MTRTTADRGLEPVEPFSPVRPTRRRRLIARAIVAPFVWLIALVVLAIVVRRTDAIELGIGVGLCSLAASLVALTLVRAARNREERRHAYRR